MTPSCWLVVLLEWSFLSFPRKFWTCSLSVLHYLLHDWKGFSPMCPSLGCWSSPTTFRVGAGISFTGYVKLHPWMKSGYHKLFYVYVRYWINRSSISCGKKMIVYFKKLTCSNLNIHLFALNNSSGSWY